MILGIDFGSSTTDAVVMDGSKVIKATSDKEELVVLLNLGHKLRVTGSGARKFSAKSKCKVVDEIKAIGKGGCFVSGKRNALVVSVGSGTCMVSANFDKIKHIGGTPVGGRTLEGLGRLLLGVVELEKIDEMAQKGDSSKLDLTLKDIYPEGIGLLPNSATASHFGKIKRYNRNDIAAALINMAAQSIATLAVFGAKAYGHKNVVLTGRVAKLKSFKKIVNNRINAISSVKVIIPENAEYATAIGASI